MGNFAKPEALVGNNITEAYVNILGNIYENAPARVKMGNRECF